MTEYSIYTLDAFGNVSFVEENLWMEESEVISRKATDARFGITRRYVRFD